MRMLYYLYHWIKYYLLKYSIHIDIRKISLINIINVLSTFLLQYMYFYKIFFSDKKNHKK